jgi:hypothetical protein
MKRSVFISHSSKDRTIAERVCAYLEAKGVSCWIAPRDVTPGKNYGAAIVDAIDECRLFVLILTDESNRSGQVAREVERAASNNDVIITFRVEPVQPSRNLEFYVSSAHWLDASEKPVEQHFDKLLTAIKDWQKSEGAIATPPLATQTPPSVAPRPPPKPRFSFSIPLISAAAGAVVVLTGVLFYKTSHRPKVEPAPAPQESISREPSPTASASATAEPSPTFVPQVVEAPTPAPVESPTASPTSSVLRRKPGEPIHAATASESPTFSATPDALRLRPGQHLTSPIPAVSASPPPATAKAPVPAEIAASSQLNENYRPNFAFDGNRATAWVPKGVGTKESISAHFKSPALIRSISILNGEGGDEEHYRMSNRVHTLRVILSDGSTQMLTFEDNLKMQKFDLVRPTTVKWIKFEIVSVFRGSKYNRSGISEIAFNQGSP